jgi:hypothetical protein
MIVGLAAILPACTGCSGARAPEPNADLASKFRQGKPYQATYSVPKGQLYSEERIYWDGAGCIRMDVAGGGPLVPQVVSVLDLNKNESTTWAEGTDVEKVYKRAPSSPGDPLMIMARPNIKAEPSDSLGTKTIQGHNCHGWKGKLNDGMQMWLDDDCGCMVELSQGNNVMALSSFSTQAPSSSMFQPPAGYTQAPEQPTLSRRRFRGFRMNPR